MAHCKNVGGALDPPPPSPSWPEKMKVYSKKRKRPSAEAEYLQAVADAAALAERGGPRGSLRIREPDLASVARALRTPTSADPPGTAMIGGVQYRIEDLPPDLGTG